MNKRSQKAKEIVLRYSRHVINPFGEMYYLEWNGQNFSSPSEAGLIEMVESAIPDNANK